VTREHNEGRDAFLAGESDNTCPYPPACGSSAQRTEWMTGYWHIRVDRFIAYLDQKYPGRRTGAIA
jgi:ribosome modulation factor